MLDGDTLYINGEIDNLILDELVAFDTSDGIKHIELNSYGGNTKFVKKISTIIRQRGLTTNVRKNAVCMSACTLLFQAGVKRTAHPSAKFMYHTVRNNSYSYDHITKDCQKTNPSLCNDVVLKHTVQLRAKTERFFNTLEYFGISSHFYSEFKRKFPAKTDPSELLKEQKKGNYLARGDWYMLAEEAMNYNIVQELNFY